ncbi:tRNA(Arg) A34 adenosine deaminase TadA [Citricoccus sp. K5]|nr:tRNA(Arg) A34 adenosine deaminase TadA [Citricoccus sp. K5]
MPIQHIAAAADWERAVDIGFYDRSTRDASIEKVGFLHASAGPRQVALVLDAVYADVTEPLVLLTMNEETLHGAGLRVVLEPGVPADPGGEWFPHVYGGPIPVGAVAGVEQIDRPRPRAEQARVVTGSTTGVHTKVSASVPAGADSRPDSGMDAAANSLIEAHVSRAIDLAASNAATNGGPFGALVVSADGQVFQGTNRVTVTNDPTAHAEVEAIRSAGLGLGTFDLSGAVLYASCEPCPMCLGAALWSRITRVVFAADRHDAAAAGFDDAAFYEYFEAPGRRDAMPVVHHPTDRAAAPFEAWRANESRSAY